MIPAAPVGFVVVKVIAVLEAGWKSSVAPAEREIAVAAFVKLRVGVPPFAVVLMTPAPAVSTIWASVSVNVPPATEPRYSNVPPAKPLPVIGSTLKIRLAESPMRFDPLATPVPVGWNCIVPPARVTLPVKPVEALNVSTVPLATAVPILRLTVMLVLAVIDVTTPWGTLVPVTTEPTTMPVVLETGMTLVFVPLAVVVVKVVAEVR